MGLSLFCKHLKSRPTLLSKVVDGLLDLISCERRGESISRSMLAGLVRMLCQLKIYHTDFEALFLEVCCHCGCDGIITCSDKPLAQESAKFYRQEGQQRMESADVRCSRRGALQPRSKRWFARVHRWLNTCVTFNVDSMKKLVASPCCHSTHRHPTYACMCAERSCCGVPRPHDSA